MNCSKMSGTESTKSNLFTEQENLPYVGPFCQVVLVVLLSSFYQFKDLRMGDMIKLSVDKRGAELLAMTKSDE